MDNNLQRYKFYDLKGIERVEDPDFRSCELAEELRKTKSKSWKVRNGYRKWGDAIGATPTSLSTIKAIVWYNKIKELLAVAGGAIYREVDGAFVDIFSEKNAGTVSVTNGDATVTGSGTNFTDDDIGKDISLGSDQLYRVKSITSTTSLELTETFDGTTASGLSYELGFSLYTLSDIRTRWTETKRYTVFSNGEQHPVKYDGQVITKLGVDPPETEVTVAQKTYTTGTVSVTNGSATVTGSGTSWSTDWDTYEIIIDGVVYQIASVGSSTSITLTENYAGSTNSGLSYTIRFRGPLRGRYYYLVTYVNKFGQESNPSPLCNNVDVYDGHITVSAIDTPEPGSGVVARKLYRTFAQDLPFESFLLTPSRETLEADIPSTILTSPTKNDTSGILNTTKSLKGSGEIDFTSAGLAQDDPDSPEDTTVPPVVDKSPAGRPIRFALPGNLIKPPPDLQYYLVTTINNAHETTYEDSNSDSSLGVSLLRDNDPPPKVSGTIEFKGRLWGWTENRLYFSKAGFFESWPITNFMQLPSGDKIQDVIHYHDSLLVFRENDVWRVDGPDRPFRRVHDKGAISPESVLSVSGVVFYLCEDGIRITNGMSSRLLSSNLEDFTERSLWREAKACHVDKFDEIWWSIDDKILVYNYEHKVFYLFNIDADAIAYHDDVGILHGNDYVFIHDKSDDDGTDITWKWRHSWLSLTKTGHNRIEAIIFQLKDRYRKTFSTLIRKDYDPTNIQNSRDVLIKNGSPSLMGVSKLGDIIFYTPRYMRLREDFRESGFKHQIEFTGTIKQFEFYGFEVAARQLGNRD